MNKIIEVDNISKKFVKKYSFLFKSKIVKETIALENVSFNVQEGEVFGLLGPNGAGKTTLIRCLSTLLIPDSGTATILGYDLIRDERKIKEHIGILFGAQSGLYPKLTCMENLQYFSTLYGINKKTADNQITQILKLLQIENEKYTLIEKLSTGMKQKINLARVLLKNPKILFLDEPTLGLDPYISKIIREFIKTELVQKRKITILLTTHYMYEAEYLCDRIALINNGKISVCNSIKNILSSLPYEQKLIIYTKDNIDPLLTLKMTDTSSNLDDLKISTFCNNGTNEIHVHGKNLDNRLTKILETLKSSIEKIELKNPNLEDAFIFYTGSKIDN